MKTFVILVCYAVLSTAVILDKEPFKRIIPADRLRDFPGHCFAATLCKNVKPGETWSLSPFCGESRCAPLLDKKNRTILAEEVTDCGPLIDLEKSPGCKLMKEDTDTTAPFPECCPVYDCEEDTEVIYANPPKSKKNKSE
ncbi:uncharacterized protein [Lepeophtheirus salmonis]|uniref:uncharacterized protein n=1 Tax=Lepeophtheirus salmonis TaxID=72036 RepID=UPI001AE1B01C|nr:uncharacterized protein LOC121117417 [Lepeophtheirus salmonis]